MEMNGLIVDFDGKKNVVMYHGLKEYPIGGMIAEYAKLHPAELKKVILCFDAVDEEPSEENLISFFVWFIEELEKNFDIITAVMITMEFLTLITDIKSMDSDGRQKCFDSINEDENQIKDYILEETGYTYFGMETMKQWLLSCYYWYADRFIAFKHSFDMLASEKEFEEEQVMAFWSLFQENIDYQHIDFKIACYEGVFHSLYTIKSSMSLLLFEAAHCMDNDTKFVKCANCGNYFVPAKRIDAIYCDFPSPQNKEKTCKEIGAQVTRANKEKTDISTKEYRKIYMKYKMIATRHPENRDAKKILAQLTNEARVWRRKMAEGSVTVDEFLQWLGQF